LRNFYVFSQIKIKKQQNRKMMKMKEAKNKLSSIVIVALLLLTLMGGSAMVASVKAALPALSNGSKFVYVLYGVYQKRN
jgi:hypothetical protein